MKAKNVFSSNFFWASFYVDESIQIVFLYYANVVLHTNKMKRKYNVVYFLKSNISCTTLLMYAWKSLNVFYYVNVYDPNSSDANRKYQFPSYTFLPLWFC